MSTGYSSVQHQTIFHIQRCLDPTLLVAYPMCHLTAPAPTHVSRSDRMGHAASRVDRPHVANRSTHDRPPHFMRLSRRLSGMPSKPWRTPWASTQKPASTSTSASISEHADDTITDMFVSCLRTYIRMESPEDFASGFLSLCCCVLSLGMGMRSKMSEPRLLRTRPSSRHCWRSEPCASRALKWLACEPTRCTRLSRLASLQEQVPYSH